jgi:hypothetical protein
MCFHLNPVGNGHDDISSEEHLKIRKPEKVIIYYPNWFFWAIWILSLDPVPLQPEAKKIWKRYKILPFVSWQWPL